MNLSRSIVLIFAFCSILLSNTGQAQSFLLANNFSFLSKVSSENTLRSNITKYADNFVGTKYRSSGTTPAGFDCSGYVRFIFQQYGYDLAHSSRELATEGKAVSKIDAKPGDLVIFAYNGSVHHVAMVYSNNNGDIEIIHSCTSKGVTIERISDLAYWTKRFYSIRRVI